MLRIKKDINLDSLKRYGFIKKYPADYGITKKSLESSYWYELSFMNKSNFYYKYDFIRIEPISRKIFIRTIKSNYWELPDVIFNMIKDNIVEIF